MELATLLQRFNVLGSQDANLASSNRLAGFERSTHI